MTLSSVNTNSTEGQLLLGALAILTTQNFTDKTPDEVLEIIRDAASKMSFPYHLYKFEEVTDTPMPWRYSAYEEVLHASRYGLIEGSKVVCEKLKAKDATFILRCINAVGHKPNPDMWVREAEEMLDKIISFDHAEMKHGESKLEFILKLARERDELSERWEIVKHLELDAYEKAKEQLDTCQAMLREVVDFSEKSRGRFCIPESLVNRIKEKL